MGTNYFARRIPTKEKREMLKALIDAGDFNTIIKEINNTYESFSVDYAGVPSGGEIHLGKRSLGWKFLWNPNMYIIRHFHMVDEHPEPGRTIRKYVDDPSTVFQLYPLTKKGIKSFIDQEDIVIVDEYGDKQNKKKFWKMALEWEQEDGWDSKTYDEYEKERCSSYNPWIQTSELIDYLKDQGYRFTNKTNSDFYSDGLRFATNTDFS